MKDVLAGIIVVLLLITGSAAPLGAYRTPLKEEKLPSFPESVQVRKSLYTHVTKPIPEALSVGEEVLKEPGERRQIKFVVERGAPWDDWGTLPADGEGGGSDESAGESAGEDSPARRGGLDQKVLRYFFHFGEGMEFSTPTAGSYIVERNLDTGELQRFIVYLKSARGYMAVVRPHQAEEGESRMDLYLSGRRLQQGIRVPASLDSLLKSSFQELMQLTSGYVDWEFYLHRPVFPGINRLGDAVNQIMPYLSSLREAEDGAMDRRGRYVRISDGKLQEESGGLNCSGFSKWVVDGFYCGQTGELLPIAPLKKKHPDVRGNRWSEKYEELKDPFFGLDWTRNLAVTMLEQQTGEDLPIEAADVDQLTYHLYEEDVGFPVEELKTILYELAVKHHNSFYLGSVNTLVNEEGQLRRHFHVAVLFPWFDEDGVLQTAVMERTAHTPLSAFINANENNYIHLVRVKVPGAFTPPGDELDPVLNR